MTKGQRAMAVAMIYPEAEKGGRGKTVRLPDGLNKQRISEARTVLTYAPDLAPNVLAGSASSSPNIAKLRHGVNLPNRWTVLRKLMASLDLLAPTNQKTGWKYQ